MNEAMRQLIRLQELMVAAEALEEKIRAMPGEVALLEKALLAAQEAGREERARLDELQKDRRKLEMELMGVEAKIRKYQDQLLEVKTNKEYQAMLHEIESAKEERAMLDEKILLEMEEADKRGADFKAYEAGIREKGRETEAGKARLQQELEALQREQAAVHEERERLIATIPGEYLEPFERVARQRKGLALVAVRDELCEGCHVRVMPKLIQEVRRATGLIACDSCKRFLYV
ncbi:MAG TPA: C4-type zinc ribbon domain-containing protein, partial [Candidatus Polarisedimenticolia bacterium]|nr:C4-type zinc ribbon domain-containing protein [Candidatus Polarisedimenticolia bacterium]